MSDIVFALVETTKCKVVHVYEDEEKANEAIPAVRSSLSSFEAKIINLKRSFAEDRIRAEKAYTYILNLDLSDDTTGIGYRNLADIIDDSLDAQRALWLYARTVIGELESSGVRPADYDLPSVATTKQKFQEISEKKERWRDEETSGIDPMKLLKSLIGKSS